MKNENTVTQKVLKPLNGFVMLFVITIGLLGSIAITIAGAKLMSQKYSHGALILVLGILLCIAFLMLYGGLKVVGPNEALVLTLFGNYYGTILKQGFHFVNPFAANNNPLYSATSEIAKLASISASSGEKSGEKSGKNAGTPAKKTISLKSSTWNNGTQKCFPPEAAPSPPANGENIHLSVQALKA